MDERLGILTEVKILCVYIRIIYICILYVYIMNVLVYVLCDLQRILHDLSLFHAYHVKWDLYCIIHQCIHHIASLQ